MQLSGKSNYCGSYLGLALASSIGVWALLAIVFSYL